MRQRARLALASAALALACRTPAPPSETPRLPAPRAPAAIPPPAAVPAPESTPPVPPAHQELAVTATAYNSVPSQGAGRGTHGAWGDRLMPGMKTIAVSRDLLELGLTRGMKVEIEGLTGHYTVMDRLPSHWTRRIDIYMGKDERAARAWGVREVRIRWKIP